MKPTGPQLGSLAPLPSYRDAVHVAVISMTAGCVLLPSERVSVKVGVDLIMRAYSTNVANSIGIVDPFLTAIVKEGELFWLVLLPNTITSLAHDWSHPAFPDVVSTHLQAKKPLTHLPSEISAIGWLSEYANEVGLSYEDLLNAATQYIVHEKYTVIGHDTPDIVYAQKETFWKNFEIVTGLKPKDTDETFISCSC